MNYSFILGIFILIYSVNFSKFFEMINKIFKNVYGYFKGCVFENFKISKNKLFIL